MKVKRIDYLDAIRGIAVWLVVLYHAYARYEHFPYGFEYASFPLLKYGYLGVELFFLISGFVILMTLERSRSFINFLYKRWLRLFPAMAIVTLLFYVGYYLFCEKWIPYYNLLPGLTFTEPYFFAYRHYKSFITQLLDIICRGEVLCYFWRYIFSIEKKRP